MLTAIKGEINSDTIIVGDFKTTLSPMDRTLRQMVKAKLNTQNHTKKHTHTHSQKEKKENNMYIYIYFYKKEESNQISKQIYR